MKTIYSTFLAIAFIFTLASCGDDDTVQPISLNFENTELGLTDQELIVNIIFSRAITEDGQLFINVNPNNLSYGENNDFYTDPAIVNSVLTLDFIKGAENISFTIKEGKSLNIAEDASVNFTLSTDAPIISIGDNMTATVVFSENFVTPEATVSANVGGSLRANQAYIDLSTGTTSSVSKDAYDLILESSGSEFNILLNYSSKMMAMSTDKSNFSEVSEADLTGVTWRGDLHMDIASGQEVSLGNFSETKFYQWDANDNTSNVFIINRGETDKNATSRGIKKVQVTKNGSTYTLKSADLDGSNEKEHTITKSADDMFKFVHLENGEVEVEPTSWDISVRTGGQAAFFPDGSYFATYNTLGAFQNHYGGVKVVAINDKEFDKITKLDAESALSGVNSDLSAIAFDWRALDFATFQYKVTEALNYVIMDTDGNYFKLKFTNYYNVTNEEEPQLNYEHLR